MLFLLICLLDVKFLCNAEVVLFLLLGVVFIIILFFFCSVVPSICVMVFQFCWVY